MVRKTLLYGGLLTVVGVGCVLTPVQWQEFAAVGTPVQFQAYVPQKKWPVVIECANPGDLTFQMKEIARVMPVTTPNVDKKNRRAYLVTATIVMPQDCLDIGFEGRNVYWYGPVVASQLITNASGTYKSQNNIYTFDAAGTACAGKALATTRSFSSIIEQGCYAKNGDGTPRREVWVMSRPQLQE